MKIHNLKLMAIVFCLLSSVFIFPKTTLALSAPSAPTDLSASAESSSEISLKWDSASNATSYYIYRASSSSATYSKIATTTSTRYTNTGLSSDKTYYYKVRAVNSAGTSSYSSSDYATTDDSDDDEDDSDESDDLSAPKDLSATKESSSKISLKWDSVSDAKSYYVYRASSSSGTYSKIGTTTSTRYTNTGLSSDKTYYYKVKAVNSSGTSAFSSKDSASTGDSDEDEDEDDEDESDDLSAPKDLNATAESSSEIYLKWDSVSDAKSYYIYRASSSSGTYSKVDSTTSTHYTDTDLSDDTTYYYKVKAVNSSGTSAYSSKDSATTDDSDDDDDDEDESDDLSAPKDLNATAESSSEISLKWDSVSDAKSYYVYRSSSSSGTYSKITTTTSTRYSNTSLSADTTYYYKVKAVNSSGTSPYSSKDSATTDKSNNLSAPTNLRATVESSSAISLTWDSVSSATSYYVYRAISSSDTYSKIATTSTTSYTNAGLLAGTTYYYKVLAVNSTGTSPYSSYEYATTKLDGTVPSVPSVPSETPSQTKFERLAGEDMYATSAEVAKSGWNTSYYAIIVSGENFSDALCSAPLAQNYNAPLLLTTKDTLNEQTKTQLSRLKVKNVIIIGGVGIISSGVEQSIKAMGIEVSRIAGNDLYETSIKIAQSMKQSDQAVVASGESFSDALSIASIAAMKGIPILLTSKDKLPDSVKAYLLKNVKSTYVVGGTGVISENVLNQLPSPKRLSGMNKYETNVSIIKEFSNELVFSKCYVSTGESFADALAGSALASLTNSPLILVSDPVDPSTLTYFRSKISSIEKEIVFGGKVVLPDSILTTLNGTSSGSTTPSTPATPSAPATITATAAGSNQINLTWDSVSGATSYFVYGATSSSGTYSHISTVTTAGYINTNLWAGTTYYYKVQAVNSAGSSSYSPIASAKTT